MGSRGPVPQPAQLHLVKNDPRKLGKDRLAAMLDETVRPAVEIPEWPADLVPQASLLVLPGSVKATRAAGSAIALEAKAEWERIAPHLAKLGLISQIDRAALVRYCFWWAVGLAASQRILELGEAALVNETPSGYKQMGVWMQIAKSADAEMKAYLVQFGMSPAARARVTPADPQAALPGMDAPKVDGWGTFPTVPESSA
jgi:P27 family predicted phage terminase small subunit